MVTIFRGLSEWTLRMCHDFWRSYWINRSEYFNARDMHGDVAEEERGAMVAGGIVRELLRE